MGAWEWEKVPLRRSKGHCKYSMLELPYFSPWLILLRHESHNTDLTRWPINHATERKAIAITGTEKTFTFVIHHINKTKTYGSSQMTRYLKPIKWVRNVSALIQKSGPMEDGRRHLAASGLDGQWEGGKDVEIYWTLTPGWLQPRILPNLINIIHLSGHFFTGLQCWITFPVVDSTVWE